MESEDASTEQEELQLSPMVLGFGTNHPHSPSNCQLPIWTALSNPGILKSVFSHLDLSPLKNANKVCSLWSRIAEPLRHPDYVINLHDRCTKLADLQDRTINVQDGLNFKIGHQFNGPKLVELLHKIKGAVGSLQLHYYPGEHGNFQDGSFSNLQLLRLKSLSWSWENLITPEFLDGFQRQNTLIFLKIIRRSPNLQHLEFSLVECRSPRLLWDSLLGPDGLPGNERFKKTLKSLTVRTTGMGFNHRDIKAFREMQLNLRILKLDVNDSDVFRLDLQLSLWLTELRSILESLHLSRTKSEIVNLELPIQMERLRSLSIDRPQFFGVDDDIISLLRGLPKLESLSLTRTSSTGVKRGGFFGGRGTLDGISFPNLEDLEITTDDFKAVDCLVWTFIPQFFPNLRKLSINVYSLSTFLACSHELRDMRIEELELRLFLRNGIGIINHRVEISKPSFTRWKKLRKLKLIYDSDVTCINGKYQVTVENAAVGINWFIRHNRPLVYNIPLENTIPANLTSLELIGWGMVDGNSLIKLLQGLPLLVQLNLQKMSIVCLDRNLVKRSEFMERIVADLSINPNLNICDNDGLFS